MSLFNEKVQGEAKKVLADMTDPLKLVLFSKKEECAACGEVESFATELVSLDSRIDVERRDIGDDAELAREMEVHHVPAIIIRHPETGRAAFTYYGMPGGYEFGAFLKILVLYSSGKLPESIGGDLLKGLEKEVNVKVFVLVSCPSCPAMAYLAGAFAYMSPMVTVEIIEANTFSDLAAEFSVGSVPKVVLNGSEELVGVHLPEEVAGKLKSL